MAQAAGPIDTPQPGPLLAATILLVTSAAAWAAFLFGQHAVIWPWVNAGAVAGLVCVLFLVLQDEEFAVLGPIWRLAVVAAAGALALHSLVRLLHLDGFVALLLGGLLLFGLALSERPLRSRAPRNSANTPPIKTLWVLAISSGLLAWLPFVSGVYEGPIGSDVGAYVARGDYLRQYGLTAQGADYSAMVGPVPRWGAAVPFAIAEVLTVSDRDALILFPILGVIGASALLGLVGWLLTDDREIAVMTTILSGTSFSLLKMAEELYANLLAWIIGLAAVALAVRRLSCWRISGISALLVIGALTHLPTALAFGAVLAVFFFWERARTQDKALSNMVLAGTLIGGFLLLLVGRPFIPPLSGATPDWDAFYAGYFRNTEFAPVLAAGGLISLRMSSTRSGRLLTSWWGVPLIPLVVLHGAEFNIYRVFLILPLPIIMSVALVKLSRRARSRLPRAIPTTLVLLIVLVHALTGSGYWWTRPVYYDSAVESDLNELREELDRLGAPETPLRFLLEDKSGVSQRFGKTNLTDFGYIQYQWILAYIGTPMNTKATVHVGTFSEYSSCAPVAGPTQEPVKFWLQYPDPPSYWHDRRMPLSCEEPLVVVRSLAPVAFEQVREDGRFQRLTESAFVFDPQVAPSPATMSNG